MSATSVAVRALDTRPLRRLLRSLGRWSGTLVLVHHRIGDAATSPLNPALFSATVEELDAQLEILQREAEVVDLASATRPSPRRGRRVAITFDDGYRDTVAVAWPLLRDRGLPATVFVSTGYLDTPRVAWWDELAWIARQAGWGTAVTNRLCAHYASLPPDRADALVARAASIAECGRAPDELAAHLWMSWDEARTARDEGLTFGGHTVTHPVLSRVDDQRLELEIEGCRATLARELEQPMELFSFPLGGPDDVDGRVDGPLARAGVRLAFTCAGGVARAGDPSPFRVPRSCAPSANGDLEARFRATLALPGVFARW